MGQDHWSKLDSADGIVFLDAHLTDKGRQQARTAHDTWQRNIALGLPAPESYYCSPLDRCLETCRITFGRLQLPAGRPFVPKVKEVRNSTKLANKFTDRRSYYAKSLANTPAISAVRRATSLDNIRSSGSRITSRRKIHYGGPIIGRQMTSSTRD